MREIKGKYTTAQIMTDNADDACIAQITEMVNHSAFNNPVVIMPDCHAGKGSVVGFTMLMTDRVIPNTIGVDIGCGMLSSYIDIPDNVDWNAIDKKIKQNVPMGFNLHNNPYVDKLRPEFTLLATKVGIDSQKFFCALGTLGGGNHFIEVGVNDAGRHLLTIHSGSRNFGLKVAGYHQAKIDKKSDLSEEIRLLRDNLIKENRQSEIPEAVSKLRSTAHKEFLSGVELEEYVSDMQVAQQYARLNRNSITNIIENACGLTMRHQLETIHNYISPINNMIRKGAVSATEDEVIIIPFNMRDGLLVCRGRGNPDWNFSAPHGAGRLSSRKQARATLSMDKFRSDMKGITTSSVSIETLDESPDAYKDPKEIESLISPTVEIIDRFKPILNIKAAEKQERK